MDEARKSSSESPAGEARRWIGRLLIAVILGESIWGLLVSATNHLALPAMARVLGGDPQSPLYLGRGDFNVPALFAAVLELFFAGIVAVFVNAWTQRPVRTRIEVVRQASSASRTSSVPSIAPGPVPVAGPAPTASAPPAQIPPAVLAPAPVTPPAEASTPPAPQSVAATKPKKPKQVYYNIVGEPIESDDE